MVQPPTAPTSVADLRSNRIEHVMHAVERIGRSAHKLAVFEAVYYHKQRTKSVGEIQQRVGLSRMRVLQVGNGLVKDQLIGQTVKDSQTAYSQYPEFQAMKAEILRLVRRPSGQKKVVTKRSPQVTLQIEGRSLRPRAPKVPSFITIDSIDSFSQVRGVAPTTGGGARSMSEEQFKEGVKTIVGETGRSKDWGGEQNDVFTTNLVVARKRRRAAFAFKGPAKRGMLRPRDMGVNGDQIQRLFKSAADVFIIQHHGQIHESVIEQMETYARLRAADQNVNVWFGVIDGRDSDRLIAAYPKSFAPKG
jgi:hypothetical protein